MLQLIRKPDRDWNKKNMTSGEQNLKSYNSLENPIGIETCAQGIHQADREVLQLIRKPDRDWNGARRDLPDARISRYNSLENPIGIETSRGEGSEKGDPRVTTH